MEGRNCYLGGVKQEKELPFLAATQVSTTNILETNTYSGKRKLHLHLHGSCWSHTYVTSIIFQWEYEANVPGVSNECRGQCPPWGPLLPLVSRSFSYFKSLTYIQAPFSPHICTYIIMGLFLKPTEFFYFYFSLFPTYQKKKRLLKKKKTHCWKVIERKHKKHAAPYKKESPVPVRPVPWLGMTAE